MGIKRNLYFASYFNDKHFFIVQINKALMMAYKLTGNKNIIFIKKIYKKRLYFFNYNIEIQTLINKGYKVLIDNSEDEYDFLWSNCKKYYNNRGIYPPIVFQKPKNRHKI